jgi:hypothetical protein
LNICGVFTSDFSLVAYLSIILSFFYLLPLADTCPKSFFLLFLTNAENRLDAHNPNHACTISYAMAMPQTITPGPHISCGNWTIAGMIIIFNTDKEAAYI